MQESWENLIDEAAAEEAQYSERFGGRTSGTSLTDYLDRWNTGGRSTYGGGYGGSSYGSGALDDCPLSSMPLTSV